MRSGVGCVFCQMALDVRNQPISDVERAQRRGGVELDAEWRRLWFFVNAYGFRGSELGDFRRGVGSADGGPGLDPERRRLSFLSVRMALNLQD